VSLDSSCVLLRWMCSTGSDCVSLDSSCVLLRCMCSTGRQCVPLDSGYVLLWFGSRLDGIVVVVR
jgi:hypothetical protein